MPFARHRYTSANKPEIIDGITTKELPLITDRRSIVAGLALLASTPVAMAQAAKPAPAQLTAAPMDFAGVKTAPQFFMGVLGPAELSLSTSQIASEKATQKGAHEFAGSNLARPSRSTWC